jgi:hypothetical protein
MMGLPMYRVGTAGGATPPIPAITSTDSATGLPSASFSVSPSFTRVDTPSGSYYVSDDSFAENRRPIEPTTKLDITQPGLVAHGALITGLVSADETGFDAAFSRVVDDLSAFTPELVGDVTFPTKLQSIATVATPTGTRQRLGLFSGQFRSDGIPEALGIGTQRRFTSLSGNVFYTLPTATDFTPSTFGPVGVTQAAGTVAFAVDIEDNVGAAAGVKRVVALYLDATGNWKSIEMSHGSSRWSGAGPLVGTTVEWFIQAVDASGNVAVTSNKSVGESVTPVEPTGDIHAEVTSGTLHPSGWYTTAAGVTISGAPGISYSLDGAPFTPGTSVPISGTGVHSVDFQGTDGSHGSLAVPIDVSNPTVAVSPTYGFGQVARATCADSGSGIAVCNVQDPLNTSSVGPHTVPVHAEDRAGHSFDATLTYNVSALALTGFFPPVENLPTLNSASAGNSVPVKFGLAGFRGFDVFAQGYPKSQQINCTTRAPMGSAISTNRLEFVYEPLTNWYKYTWKTEKSWRNTCRQLIVLLKDGTTEKRANFRFN